MRKIKEIHDQFKAWKLEVGKLKKNDHYGTAWALIIMNYYKSRSGNT